MQSVYVRTLPLSQSSDECERHIEWEEHGRFRVAASTKKMSRLAARKGGPVTEFQSSAGVHTGEQAGVVEAEEGALEVAIMVVVEVMTGEVVDQMVEVLVDHTHSHEGGVQDSSTQDMRGCAG